jgi:hypothetical protein
MNRGNSWEKTKVKLASDLISDIPVLSSTDPEHILNFLIRAKHVLELKWELRELDQEKNSKDMEKFWEEALGHLKKARDKVARRYNAGRQQAEFAVHDLVMVRLHPISSKSQRRSAKLDCMWSVPFKIAKLTSPVTVCLANPDTGVIVRKAHVSQLKRYFQAT